MHQTSLVEKLLPLVEAVKQATGRNVHLSTVLRWSQRGSRGIRLESKVLGGRRLCSVEAVHRFIELTTRASDIGEPPAIASPSVQEANHQKAKLRLAAALDES